MNDPFESALRTGLSDAARDWAPLESPAAIGDRLLRRIRRRRAQKAGAAAGLVAAGLAAVLLVGQVVAEPQVVHQVASPTTSAPGGPGSEKPVVTGPATTNGPATTTTTTATTATTATTLGGRGPRPEVGPRWTPPPPPVTVPVTLPPTTRPPVTAPVTTQPPPNTTLPPPTTTTVTTAPPPQVFTITAQDFGKTINVRAGDEIVVDLTPCPGGSWGAVNVNAPSVLVRQSPPATVPPPGTALADYQAAIAGRARITSRQHSTCAATPSLAFAVTIVVS